MDYPFCLPAVGVDVGGLDAEGIEGLVDFLADGDSCVGASSGSGLQLNPPIAGHEDCEEVELLYGRHAVDDP